MSLVVPAPGEGGQGSDGEQHDRRDDPADAPGLHGFVRFAVDEGPHRQ